MGAWELLTTLEEKVDPSRAALVVVDVQNDFFHEEGYLGKLGAPLGAIQAMVPPLRRLMDEARAAGVRVVHVISHHDEAYASPPLTEQKLRNGHNLTDPDGRQRKDAPYCLKGTFGADLYGVEALPGEEVVVKYRYSGFHGTNLDLLLRGWGIQTVILTGAATNVCVESTARDVYSHDYYLVFVSDCTATMSPDEHAYTLRHMDKYFGHVASSDELIAAWEAAAQRTDTMSSSSTGIPNGSEPIPTAERAWVPASP